MQDLRIYEYTTALTGTTHLIRQSGKSERTLCGLAMFIPADWTIGDETYSGIASDCGDCVKVVQKEQPF
jgi:hypothetical protein